MLKNSAIGVLSKLFSLSPEIVRQIIGLLEEGNTVPFIARYRRQSTGNLSDQSLRKFEKEWQRLVALEERKEEILGILKNRDKLTPELAADIDRAENLTILEDIYRPYKQKRQTRAAKALEQGLEPLSELFFHKDISEALLIGRAEQLLPRIPERKNAEDVLQGAADIIAEKISDRADVRKGLRKLLRQSLCVNTSRKSDEDSVYTMYYDYQEKLSEMEAHRFLAIARGERENVLKVDLIAPDDKIIAYLARFFIPSESLIYPRWYKICEDSWKRLLAPSLKKELWRQKAEQAEDVSIALFAENLKNLLLQAPLPGKKILGWDPGYTHGCKLASIDEQGNILDTEIIFPFSSKKESLLSEQKLTAMLAENPVDLIAVGNGTASRESELWLASYMAERKKKIPWLIVSEAGASVYSASELAATEFPDLDLNLRSAVSIARRVQDPLAELVKIDPKAIGVGQYQHDLNQKKLEDALRAVVEDCVNQVGVELNTASPHILAYVSGLTSKIAAEIVRKRQELSGFSSREQLKEVRYLGEKTFEQAAGFLRIAEAPLYLDRTAVHPESYAIAQKIADYYQMPVSRELGERLEKEEAEILEARFSVDPYTLRDITEGLLKPNRDPREDIEKPAFKTDILKASDLKPGMTLAGTVRNVVAFGAFVDVGIEHDGLIHVSKLSKSFVKDPTQIVKVGDQVQVEVLSYEPANERLQLALIGKSQ